MKTIQVEVHRSIDNTHATLVFSRATKTMIICVDDKGNEYRFARKTGYMVGVTTPVMAYALTSDSMLKLSGV